MPRFEIDGVACDAAVGQTLLEALDAKGLLMQGVDIPHYCWHPKLSIAGSCRMCQVDVEFPVARPEAPDSPRVKLEIACQLVVRDGMVVRTKTERVSAARAGVSELLLVNHPLDCPICDQAGECKLQDYAFEYGVHAARAREPRRALAKNVELGPAVVLDQERCILCRRCVRFCREIPKTGELAVVGRGDRAVIESFPGAPLDNAYSMNVADLCPVGALTTRDARFKQRVWLLDEVSALCTGCSRGCNVHAGVADNQVQRFVPRRNDEVNDTWLCDDGRMSYREVGSPARLMHPLVRDRDGVLAASSLDAALAEAGARLQRLSEAQGAGVIAGVASAHASNEDLYVFGRFLDALGTDCRAVALRRGEADELLVQSEKAANAAGARALGFGDAQPVVERIRGGLVRGIVVLGHDLLDAELQGELSALERLDTLVALDTHHSDIERVAHVVLPARHAAEKTGTYVNHAGRVQRSFALVEPAFEAYAEAQILALLAAVMGFDGFEGRYDVRRLSDAIGDSFSAFSGIDIGSVGEGGVVLRGDAPDEVGERGRA